jgi:ABC-2 type transport system ATP-binding protein
MLALFAPMSTTDLTDERGAARETADASSAETNKKFALSVRNLSKTYPLPLARLRNFFRRTTKPPVEALRDVSLEVREGEIFGLIGPNGAGKTTLTKIIATLVQPTAGAVTVKGYDSVLDEEKVREQVGLATAEERSFYWRLTSEQNLLFFARLYGIRSDAARMRIRELFARFEFEEMARRRFGELSTGNKQKLAVIRAMLAKPPVLLLDEPTRSLDPLAAARMRALIQSLSTAKRPVSILLTSHNLAEVEELCTRVAIISRGQIRAIDTPGNLRALHKQTERVRLTVTGITRERAARVLGNQPDDFELHALDQSLVVVFTRETGDDLLDGAVRALLEAGARITDLDSERATLLDVLESYERESTGAQEN